MIKNLDDLVSGVENTSTGGGDYSPLPKGNYKLELTDVKPWETKVIKSLDVIQFDDKYQKVKDSSGNDVKETVKNVTIFETNLTFKVLDGKHKGRLIFDKVSTYPNRPWAIPNLIHALGKPNLRLSQLNTLIGTTCMGYVDTESYDKDITNDDGFDETIKVTKNVIKRYKAIETIDEDDLSDI
jgi:hypothetical protein